MCAMPAFADRANIVRTICCSGLKKIPKNSCCHREKIRSNNGRLAVVNMLIAYSVSMSHQLNDMREGAN